MLVCRPLTDVKATGVSGSAEGSGDVTTKEHAEYVIHSRKTRWSLKIEL